MEDRKRRRSFASRSKSVPKTEEEEEEGGGMEEEGKQRALELKKISKNLHKLKSFESFRFVSTAINYSLIAEEQTRLEVASFKRALGKSATRKTSTAKKRITDPLSSDSDSFSVMLKREKGKGKLKPPVKKSNDGDNSDDQSSNADDEEESITSQLPLPLNMQGGKKKDRDDFSHLEFSDDEENIPRVNPQKDLPGSGDEYGESENDPSNITRDKAIVDLQLDILDPKFDVSPDQDVAISGDDSNLQKLIKTSKLKGFLKSEGCKEDYRNLGQSIFSVLAKQENCLFNTPISETSKTPGLKLLRESNKQLKSTFGTKLESNPLYVANEIAINELISERACNLFEVSKSSFLLTRVIETIFKFFSYNAINSLGSMGGWSTAQKTTAKKLFNDILPKLCKEQKKLLANARTKKIFKSIFHFLHLIFKVLDEKSFIKKVEDCWKCGSTSELHHDMYVCFKGKLEPFGIIFKNVNDLLIILKTDVDLKSIFNMLLEKPIVKYPRLRSYEFMIRGVANSIRYPIMLEPEKPTKFNQKWMVQNSNGKPGQY